MRVLLTGHRGRLGPTIFRRLVEAGHVVTGFDLTDGDDILDFEAVKRAAAGTDVIVHVAGIAGDRARTPAEMMSVNLAGTINVVFAAEAQGARRIVYLSSGRALGMLDRAPDYLPLDDNHRGLPPSPYGLAKWLAEELCESFTQRTAIDTICLRSVAVFTDAEYRASPRSVKTIPPGRVWDLGVHIDIRDLANAVTAAVTCAFRGHTRILLAAADIAEERPTLELLRSYLPQVPWSGGAEFDADSHRSLIDISKAKKILGWAPAYAWPGRSAANG